MLDNVGGWEVIVIVLVGLFVLGPERLPEAAAWVAKTVRTIRDYATGARDQLRNELGSEFDDFRKPLEDLRSVRDLDPRRAVRQHLFASGQDGPAPLSAHSPDRSASGEPAAPGRAVTGATDTTGIPAGGAHSLVKGRSSTADGPDLRAKPLQPGEAAPYDADAT